MASRPVPLQTTDSPRVLVVDDEPGCVEEYCETLDDLGYDHVSATSGLEALSLLASDPSIGIVLTDVRMPGMDGLSLLSQIQSRYAGRRPLVSIVITGYGTLDLAVAAMRYDAVDFLSKPISRAEYAAALQRASRSWAAQADIAQSTRIAELSEEVARIAALLSVKTGAAGSMADAQAAPTPEDLRARLQDIIHARKTRQRYFNSELFADPAWDILLDLAAARLDKKSIPVSSACIAAAVPMSTALRWVREMTSAGLLRRWTDPQDKRRDLLELTDEAMSSMMTYLSTIPKVGGI